MPVLGVGVLNPLRGCFGVEIQARKMAGVGIVAKADIHRVSPMIDSGFQRGQIARGTDQLQRLRLGRCCRNSHIYFPRSRAIAR
jgi:hypothetical protein